MNPMKKLVVLLTLASCSMLAEAHRAWILPAATVLSGEDPWVTFDAAVSNDIFHTDHAPLRTNTIVATGPDGSEQTLQNISTGKYRSTFDLNLSKTGTYKVAAVYGGLQARWETDEGERRYWPPRGEQSTPEGFAKAVPKKAKNLKVTQSSRRIETFVTSGEPDTRALQSTGSGFELEAITHPNDLFAGEEARFRFLIDGKAAAGAEVTVIPGGMRYRNDQAAIEVKTDQKGEFVLTWPAAGLYWLNARYSDDKATKPATERSGNYTATFEVLPE